MATPLERFVRRLTRLEREVKHLGSTPQLAYSSVEGGSLDVKDGEGVVRQVIGLQVDGTYGLSDLNADAPPKPGAPNLSARPEVLSIHSFGQTENGADWPLDVVQIDVHASSTSGFSESLVTRVGSVAPNVGGTYTLSVAPGIVYVKLVAVNRAGVTGTPSDEVWITVPANATAEALEGIEEEFQAIRDEAIAGDSENAEIIEGVVDDINDALALRPVPIQSTLAPGSTANTVGQIWEQFDTLTHPRKLKAVWRGLGGASWASVSLDPTYIPVLDINSGTAGSLAASRLLITDLQDYVRDPSFDGIGTWGLGDPATAAAYISNNSPRPDDRNGKHLRFETARIANGGSTSTVEPMFPVTPGEQFNVTMKYRRAGSLQAGGVIALRFYYYDAAGAIMPATGYYAERSIGVATLNDYTWRDSTPLEVTIPDGCAFARVYPLMYSVQQAGGGFYDVDEIHCRKRFGGELAVDGFLRARHANFDFVKSLLLQGRLIETNEDPALGFKTSDAGTVWYDSDPASPYYKTARTLVDPTSGKISAIGGTMEASSFVGSSFTGSVFEGGQIYIAGGVAASRPQAFSGTALPAGWTQSESESGITIPAATVVTSGYPSGGVGSVLKLDSGPAGVSTSGSAWVKVKPDYVTNDFEAVIRYRLAVDNSNTFFQSTLATVRFNTVDFSNHYELILEATSVELSSDAQAVNNLKFTHTFPTGSQWMNVRVRKAAGAISLTAWRDGQAEPAAKSKVLTTIVGSGPVEIQISKNTYFSTTDGQVLWIDKFDVNELQTGFKVNPDGTGEWPAIGLSQGDAAWRTIGGAGQPAFTPGWSADGGTVQFRKSPTGDVSIVGRAAPGSGTTAFTLPVGYRPTRDLTDIMGKADGSGKFVLIDILTTGAVVVRGTAGSAWVALTCQFPTV